MQQTRYYIDVEGIKDGPHDLITIMRRIRAQKIQPNTRLYVNDNDTPIPAYQLDDIAMFFVQTPQSGGDVSNPALSLKSLISDGWRFTTQHTSMMAFAGGFICLMALLNLVFSKDFGILKSMMITWTLFMICYHLYMIFTLRLYRGQPVSSDFIKHNLRPVFFPLIIGAALLALMMLGGAILLVIPAIAIAMYYVFMPFFIFDRKLGVVASMYASRLLVRKHNGCYQAPILVLVLTLFLSTFLIIPMPLVMPVVSAALTRIYEDLSAS